MKALTIDILLALAVAAAWLGAAGLLTLKTPFDRLHAVGFVTIVSGILVTLAVIVAQPFSAVALKALIVIVAFVVTAAVLTHSIGRMLRVRDESRDQP